MKQRPLVSIIIPAYKETFFYEALWCALNQDYESLEIIIGDDSSTCLIGNIVSAARENSRILLDYFKNPQPLGERGNLIACLARAKGEYIKFFYDDDLMETRCVSALVDALEKPGVVLATSRRRLINSDGERVADIMATLSPVAEDSILQGQDVISYVCDSSLNFIGEPSTVLCRHQDLLDLLKQPDGLFFLHGHDMPFFIDMSLYAKLLQRGNLAYLVHPWSSFRLSSQQTSNEAQHTPLLAIKTYKNFPKALKESGWYAPQHPEDSAIIRAAPLNNTSSWQEINLKSGFSLSHKSATLTQWLDVRRLTPVQMPLVARYLSQQPDAITVGVVIVGNNASLREETLDSLTLLSHGTVSLQPLIIDEGSASEINKIIFASQADWFICLQAGDKFLSSGLVMLANALCEAGDALAIYGDAILREEGYITKAAFRPDFNLDFFLSSPDMMSQNWLIRKDALVALNGYREELYPAHEFDLAIRLVEGAGIAAVKHFHEPLVNVLSSPAASIRQQQVIAEHLQRRGFPNAQLVVQGEGKYRIWYGHQEQPLVSIIIPTRDQISMLIACVTSLMEKTNYRNYEIIIIDNDSETEEAKTWLAGIDDLASRQIRVLRYPYVFNYSAMNNYAAQEAQGEYLLLLNNDTAIIDGHWLDAMLNHALRPEVGIVGAKLLYPDGNIQHAGVILGLRSPAEHPYNGVAPETSGYMHRLQVDQNYTIVTAACMLVRKSVYFDVGGLDETAFKISYNDVDFCLKVQQKGYLTVWTPYARVMHEGSVSQKTVDKAKFQLKLDRFLAEQDTFLQKWMPQTINDPAYNANLSLSGKGFELNIHSQRTWRPLSGRPLPVVMTWQGSNKDSARKRIQLPLACLTENGRVEGVNVDSMLYLTEIAQYQPDSLIIQRQLSTHFHRWAERLDRVTPIFKVMELDENVLRLPLTGQERGDITGDVGKLLRASLDRVDRVVVSTQGLAEVIGSMHSDIVVVESLLSADWKALTSAKGRGSKPRIGINAQGIRNTDIALITDLILEMAGRVEWVFIGQCSPRIRSSLTEYWPDIVPASFPAVLAALNLDLALMPLENTPVNIGLGYSRLLEYGACAIPVICSDVENYREDFTVTFVKNRLSDWREAIRLHLNDTDDSHQQGRRLQQQVRDRGIANDETISTWADAWLSQTGRL